MKTKYTGSELAAQKHINRWCDEMRKLRDCLHFDDSPDIDTSHLDTAIGELTAMFRKIEDGTEDGIDVLFEDCDHIPVSFQ